VEGEGFSGIAKIFIMFGAAHGNHDSQKVIHHRTFFQKQIFSTIMKHVPPQLNAAILTELKLVEKNSSKYNFTACKTLRMQNSTHV